MHAKENQRSHVRVVVAADISNFGEGQLPTGNAHGGWMATRLFFSLVVVTATLVGCGSGSDGAQGPPVPPPPAPEASTAMPELDASIPPSDPKKYAAIEDVKDWKNPFLIVSESGVEIVVGDRRSQIPIEALAATLAKLPATAWPYGRVVAARTRPGAGAPAQDAEARVEEALGPLGVVVEWWPSE
jgi:hypothetical protein